jgi:hypothetical protein
MPKGPPRVELAIPERKIADLAAIGCTDSEIAAVAEVSETLVKVRYRDLIHKGREGFKTRIREMQLKRALEGSDTMLVWLGKVVLRQQESTNVNIGATDTLAAFIQSIREASPASPQLDGQTLPPREPLPD